jgi:hypothetical protein
LCARQRIVRLAASGSPSNAWASSWCNSRNRVRDTVAPARRHRCTARHHGHAPRAARCPASAVDRAGAECVYGSCFRVTAALLSTALLRKALLPPALLRTPLQLAALMLQLAALGVGRRTSAFRAARPRGAAPAHGPLRASGRGRRETIGPGPVRADRRIPGTR